ncbi:MAG: ADP-ribosylation/Crystallin [Capsulimonas sp.]|jgi:ADP-ribosylglycohydrolase|nr:ADP-ribosylation/Crystallin [Capsulimonas sp.]
MSRNASGCLYGLAFGDALGADTEFMKVEEILAKYPPNGPTSLTGRPIRVTDDTQMTIAMGEALHRAGTDLSPATLEKELRKTFLRWFRSPDNDRAPGMTCLRACDGLEKGWDWRKATIESSKGCGANMRVAPVGLLNTDPTTRAAIAQFQAALTHGHATGLAAADLTAAAVADLLGGGDLNGLTRRLREYAHSQREVYHEEWLGDLWLQPMMKSPAAFIAQGWEECLWRMDDLDAALKNPNREVDPCTLTGAGWVAEEAFATGLLCFLLFPDNPIAAIQRAAVSSGDSDSIACLTGAFAGAHWGLTAWPEEWIANIEYRDQLETLGAYWD